MYKIGFLGIGKMGSAILSGIVKANIYSYNEVAIYTTNENHREYYSNLGCNILDSEISLFLNSEIILLAVKPQKFSEALKEANIYDFNNRAVISIAAGISISYIEGYFKNATIIRVMPNTPALINDASSTICANNKNEYYSKALDIFKSIGAVVEVEENQIDELIPVNGSMPAYLYLFAKTFINNAVNRGIDYDTAKLLCAKAIIGSANMILSSSDDIDTLINNVCSKGGTTIEGLNKLYEEGFIDAINSCYDACVRRSKELNK